MKMIIQERTMLKMPIPTLRLQHQPKWVTSCAPGRCMTKEGTTATNTQQIICAKPDSIKNCAPMAMAFEMMAHETIHKIIESNWKASAMRKKRTNFLARWSDMREDIEVK